MKDEIKEILESLKDNIPVEEHRSEETSDGLTHYEEDKDSWQYKLLDYITNLQHEIERLKRLAEKDYTELNIAEMNATIYKSRCEKAIEKLESIRIFGLRFGKTLFSTLINETIDILNGGDEE